MLVLKRRFGERIMIGDSIIVEVLETSGSFVRLGIVAPDDVAVDREEVRKDKERRGNAGLVRGS